MTDAARKGDLSRGREAEYLRNRIIDENNSDEPKVSFDELFLLSKFIQLRAGSVWVTDEFKLCMGEIVMNRLSSPDFPDTLEEVIYQEGQFEGVLTENFQCHLLPSYRCVEAAAKLLQGERMMSEEVLYASGEKNGEVYALYSDARIGYTYFCLGEKAEKKE